MATFLSTLFLVVCVLLIIVVLLQKGRGGGLGAALGGGAGQSAFGTRTGDVFTWVTIVLTALFLLLAIITTVVYRPPVTPVDMPVFDPPAWPAGASKEIPVNMAVPGAKDDTVIHYTLDGTTPTDKSPAYAKSAIMVAEGTTLKAVAIRHSRSSKVHEVKYERPQLNTAAPATAPVEAPATRPAASAATAPAL